MEAPSYAHSQLANKNGPSADDISDQLKFIRKVYTILAVQLTLTAGAIVAAAVPNVAGARVEAQLRAARAALRRERFVDPGARRGARRGHGEHLGGFAARGSRLQAASV